MAIDGPVIGLQPTFTLKEPKGPDQSFEAHFLAGWQETISVMCAILEQRASAKRAKEALEAQIDPLSALSPKEIEEAFQAQKEFDERIAQKREFVRLNSAAKSGGITESERDSALRRYQVNIDSLAPRRYITDDAIDLAFNAIKTPPGVCLVDSVPAQCLLPVHADSNWERARDVASSIPKDAKVIIFPINDGVTSKGGRLAEGGNHWTGLMYDRRNPAKPTFYYYDSLSQRDPSRLGQRTASKIYELMEGPGRRPRDAKFQVRRAPQQTAPDCGIMLAEVSRVTVERCARNPNAPIGDINYNDIRNPEAVRQNLIAKFEARRKSFLDNLRLVPSKPAPAVTRSNISSTIADTIKALDGCTDEAILKRRDVKLAPPDRGSGRIVRQMPNGDVVIQVADNRRPDSTNPLYLVKHDRLQVTGPYKVGDRVRYTADTQAHDKAKSQHMSKGHASLK